MEQNSLRHHGIKGMRWGVRRSQEELGNDRPSKKEQRVWKKLGRIAEQGRDAKARQSARLMNAVQPGAKKIVKAMDKAERLEAAGKDSTKARNKVEKLDAKYRPLAELAMKSMSGLSPEQIERGRKEVKRSIESPFGNIILGLSDVRKIKKYEKYFV